DHEIGRLDLVERRPHEPRDRIGLAGEARRHTIKLIADDYDALIPRSGIAADAVVGTAVGAQILPEITALVAHHRALILEAEAEHDVGPAPVSTRDELELLAVVETAQAADLNVHAFEVVAHDVVDDTGDRIGPVHGRST